MNTLAEKLHKWSLNELNLVSEGGASKVPDINNFRSLTKGKNKKIWNYVVNHVRSQSAVRDIKRTLYIKQLLKEKEDNVSPSIDSSVDLGKLQSAVSRAVEKRANLMRTISTVEERLLNLEQQIQSTKEETFKINQKTAFFELLNQQLIERNLSVRNLYSEISSHKKELIAYESASVCKKALMTEPHDFLNEMIGNYHENVSGIKDLLNLIAMCRQNFNKDKDNTDTLTASVFETTNKLNKRSVLLTDLVVLLREISVSDLQYFTTTSLQSFSSEELMIYGNKRDSVKVLLAHLKCKNVYSSISTIKNKKQIEKLTVMKEKIFEDKIKDAKLEPNDLDYDLKCTLVEKLAENEALVVSNNYMDNYLENITNKTDLILGNLHNQKLCNDELSSVLQKFYDSSDLTYYLMYIASGAFQKVLDDLNNLQTFAHKDMFKSPLPGKECLEMLKMSLISDRTQSLDYCDKTNVMKRSFTKPFANDYPLSSAVLKSLNIEPFQNISYLCENWTHMKQKLRTEIMAYSEEFVDSSSVNISEMYSNILKMLEKMKFSVEKGLLFITKGMIFFDKTKTELQEWWEQNAQFIPHIEYEGKTLKMWIDILHVLSDFEPQTHPEK